MTYCWKVPGHYNSSSQLIKLTSPYQLSYRQDKTHIVSTDFLVKADCIVPSQASRWSELVHKDSSKVSYLARRIRTAVPTDGCEPLDANSVSHLHTGILSSRTHLDDNADAFMATNLPQQQCSAFCPGALHSLDGTATYLPLVCWERHLAPRVHHDAQIRVAYS